MSILSFQLQCNVLLERFGLNTILSLIIHMDCSHYYSAIGRKSTILILLSIPESTGSTGSKLGTDMMTPLLITYVVLKISQHLY